VPVAFGDGGERPTMEGAGRRSRGMGIVARRAAEKELILRTLNPTRGAQAEAARRMGLSRSTLPTNSPSMEPARPNSSGLNAFPAVRTTWTSKNLVGPLRQNELPEAPTRAEPRAA
jgi:hypothetical protein